MRPNANLCLCFWILCVSLPVSPVSAQPAPNQPSKPLAGEPPSVGVRLHTPTSLGADDASAIELNPAGIAVLPAWSLVLHHSELRSSGRVQGAGDALFLALPVPLASRLAFGLGLQWLRPADAIGYADSVKLSFATAWRPSPAIALGVALHTFIADDDPFLDDLTTFDLGLVLRPYEWIAAGLTVRDVSTPVVDGFPLQRVYDIELATRPLRSDRLELGLGLQIGERRGDVDPYLRLAAEPLPGLRLLAHAQLLRRDFYRSGDDETDFRATVGLQVALERIAVAASAVLGRSMDSGFGPLGDDEAARSAFQGATVSLRLDGARRRPLLGPPARIVELELTGKLDQYEMIRLVRLLHAAERHRDVRSLLLRIDRLALGWAQAQELRAWIQRLRRGGKRVFAYLGTPSAPEYYLAAAADWVLLENGGGIQLKGLAVERVYLRGLFDKLGVNPQFIKVAEYKSAPETLTRTGPSDPAKEMRESLATDLFGQLVADLARDRRRSTGKMRALIDAGPFTAKDAVEARLVDELVEPDHLKRRIQRLARARFADASVLARAADRWPVGPAVAVVVIEGDIVRGKSVKVPLLDRSLVGDDTIIEALGRARRNRRVGAIVLRVNSPGGSAFASRRIWREVRRTRRVKPVIVSLGNLAASGGYFAACGGDRIFAQPATLTGSIGIFTGKFDLSGLLSKLGVSTDSTQRGKRATMTSSYRPFSEEERAFILSRLRYYYDLFLDAVGRGRNMAREAVDRVGRGRVWTGHQARERRLVDAYGGLIEAIDEAKRRAGIDLERPVDLVVLPRRKRTLLERATGLMAGEGAQTALPPAVVRQLDHLPAPLWYATSGDPLARLPYEIDFGE